MYEMRNHSYSRSISPSSISSCSRTTRSTSTYGELTKENLRRFELEQERVAQERRLKKQMMMAEMEKPTSPVPSYRSQQQPQIYVLERVVDVDIPKEDEKYLCCCKCTHVFRGAWLVGILQAVFCLVALIVVIVNYSRLGWNYLNHFVAVVCICLCYIVVLTFHFCALQGKTACMLIPNLLTQLMSMILLIVACVLLGLSLSGPDQSRLVIWAGWGPLYGDLAKEAGWSLLVVGMVLISCCILAILFNIWFFHITFKCYRFLNDSRRKHAGLVYNEPEKTNSTANIPVSK